MRNLLRRCADSPKGCGVAAFWLTAVILLVHYSLKYGLNAPPSTTTGDEMSYDIIGWNLSQGAGFAEGGDAPEFFRPYVQAGRLSPSQMETYAGSIPELVAHRPPLFPTAIAVMNRLFGRQFHATRLMNVAATAGTCGLLVWYLVKTQGAAAALIGFGMLLVVDTRTRLYGRAILTEATATFLMTTTTVLLIHLREKGHWRFVVLSGLVCGLLILDRTVFILWLPGLAMIVALLVARAAFGDANNVEGSRWKKPMVAGVAFTVSALLVVSPWTIRNIRALETIMPFGTQGMSQLPAGFSDLAVARKGLWSGAPTTRLRKQVEDPSMTRLEEDVARARLAQDEAFRWIRDNPGQSVGLAGMKIWQEYRPRAPTEWLITLAALVGLLLTIRQPDTQLFMAIHAISCIAIGCTWSVEGRFVLPLMFSIHALAAMALVRIFRLCLIAKPSTS